MQRNPRLAIFTIPTLDHFLPDIVLRLPSASTWDVRIFSIAAPTALQAALAWTDDPNNDSLWFEFCWPPFPHLIETTDFGGRRVIMRVHRIEAAETMHVANMAWAKVDDVIVVSHDMYQRVLTAAPEVGLINRLHIVPNGVDVDRFERRNTADMFRIGWCGLMTLRKNPTLALQILLKLRTIDSRYHLNLSGKGCDQFAYETFMYTADQLGLLPAIQWDGSVEQSEMPRWHSHHGVLLHTSLHESFGYAIAEAAAVGCDIVIADHPGAHETWPESTLFSSIDQAVALIQNAKWGRWRDFVVNNYSINSQIRKIVCVLDGNVAPPCGHTSDVLCKEGVAVR